MYSEWKDISVNQIKPLLRYNHCTCIFKNKGLMFLYGG